METTTQIPAHNIFSFGGITFSSNFDNGNLARVEQVQNKTFDFRIWTAPDNMGTSYQSKHCAWYHFMVTGLPMGCVLRIQIINTSNHAGLYKYDMRPVYRSNSTNQKWVRIKSSVRFQKENDVPQLFFEHGVDANDDKLFFAFTYPYSYSMLQNELAQYDTHRNVCDNKNSIFYQRELVTRSLDGRRIDLITITSIENTSPRVHKNDITNQSQQTVDHEPLLSGLFPETRTADERPPLFLDKDIVFISARVHPGEVPAQHTFQGILNLLMDQNDLQAKELRARYVFKLIPMLNPDGVYRGHFRMDQLGHNLNRYYINCDPLLHPSIFAAKSLTDYYAAIGKLCFYLDCHSHASKRGCFIYGNVLNSAEDQIQNQLLCKLISMNTAHFDYEGCLFSRDHMTRIDPGDQAKGLTAEGSGRVSTYLTHGLIHSYTIECNYNTSRVGNEIAAPDTDPGGSVVTPSSAFTTNPEKYTPSTYAGVGRACLVALLDLRGHNPCSRIAKSKFKTLDRVRNSIMMEVRNRKEYAGKALSRERRRTVQGLLSKNNNNITSTAFGGGVLATGGAGGGNPSQQQQHNAVLTSVDDLCWRRVVETTSTGDYNFNINTTTTNIINSNSNSSKSFLSGNNINYKQPDSGRNSTNASPSSTAANNNNNNSGAAAPSSDAFFISARNDGSKRRILSGKRSPFSSNGYSNNVVDNNDNSSSSGKSGLNPLPPQTCRENSNNYHNSNSSINQSVYANPHQRRSSSFSGSSYYSNAMSQATAAATVTPTTSPVDGNLVNDSVSDSPYVGSSNNNYSSNNNSNGIAMIAGGNSSSSNGSEDTVSAVTIPAAVATAAISSVGHTRPPSASSTRRRNVVADAVLNNNGNNSISTVVGAGSSSNNNQRNPARTIVPAAANETASTISGGGNNCVIRNPTPPGNYINNISYNSSSNNTNVVEQSAGAAAPVAYIHTNALVPRLGSSASISNKLQQQDSSSSRTSSNNSRLLAVTPPTGVIGTGAATYRADNYKDQQQALLMPLDDIRLCNSATASSANGSRSNSQTTQQRNSRPSSARNNNSSSSNSTSNNNGASAMVLDAMAGVTTISSTSNKSQNSNISSSNLPDNSNGSGSGNTGRKILGKKLHAAGVALLMNGSKAPVISTATPSTGSSTSNCMMIDHVNNNSNSSGISNNYNTAAVTASSSIGLLDTRMQSLRVGSNSSSAILNQSHQHSYNNKRVGSGAEYTAAASNNNTSSISDVLEVTGITAIRTASSSSSNAMSHSASSSSASSLLLTNVAATAVMNEDITKGEVYYLNNNNSSSSGGEVPSLPLPSFTSSNYNISNSNHS